MRYLRVAIVAAFAALASGCASSRQGPIELTSSDFDLDPLVGRWSGDYTGKETGRSGTISFTLNAGESFASGAVVMLPHSVASAASSDRANATNAVTTTPREVINIRFIRKEGGNLVGTLDPYIDPDCRCRVLTTFQGKFVDAKTIEGTFTTTGVEPGRAPTTGTWKVNRRNKL